MDGNVSVNKDDNFKGLFFYKLSSPTTYEEDITKNCKLTINEIDHNFITLKNTDIQNIEFDETTCELKLTQRNGEQFHTFIDISQFTKNFDVTWDDENASLVFTYDDKKIIINNFVSSVVNQTVNEIIDDVVHRTMTDSTLNGIGLNKKPLGVNPLLFPGTYKSVESLIDVTKGETLPNVDDVKKGIRYLTYETINKYGLFYEYKSIEKIHNDLENGWRVPSKEDWDDMLNTIELCDNQRTHSTKLCYPIATTAGQYAGKLLKANEIWKINTNTIVSSSTTINEPSINPLSTKGVDKYGFDILPYSLNNTLNEEAEFWTLTEHDIKHIFVKRFTYNNSGVIQLAKNKTDFCNLRLVKDYTGNNFQDIEIIRGKCYKTVLMPSNNTEHGFSIWTAFNVDFDDEKYQPFVPKNTTIETKNIYYINEWDGEKWLKKELQEGDSLIIKQCNGEINNHKYQIINGVLVDLDTKYINMIGIVQQDINKINENINEITSIIVENEKNIDLKINIIKDDLSELASANTEAHTALSEAIDTNAEAIEMLDAKVKENEEVVAAALVDLKANTVAIEELASANTKANEALSGAIDTNAEAISANTVAIEELASANTEAHTALSEAIDTNAEAISANTVAIEELASANTEAHTALSSAIASANTRIDDVVESVSDLQNDLQTLNTENTEVHTTLFGAIDANKAILDTLKIKDVKNGDKMLAVDADGKLSSTFTVDYVSADNKIYFKGLDDSDLGSIDTTDFVKDGMLQDVTIDKTGGKTELVFTWNITDEVNSAITKTTRLTVNDFLDGTELSNLQAAFDTHVASANTMHLSATDRAEFDSLIQNYSKTTLDEKFTSINNALTANTDAHATLSQEIVSANTRIDGVASDLSDLAIANTEAHTALSGAIDTNAEAISANTVAIEEVKNDYKIADKIIAKNVDVLSTKVDSVESLLKEHLTVLDLVDLNTLTKSGKYKLKGINDSHSYHLPILNAAPGHSVEIDLTVLDSSLESPNHISPIEICITQFLILSNRTAHEGKSYIRSYNQNNGSSLDGSGEWTDWKVFQNVTETYLNTNDLSYNIQGEVSIGGLNSMIDNGVYTGAYINDLTALQDPNKLKYIETFTLTVINDYIAASATHFPRKISQFKQSIDNLTNIPSFKVRVGIGEDNIEWGEWQDISGDKSALLSLQERVEESEKVIAYTLVDMNNKFEETNKKIKTIETNIDLLKNMNIDCGTFEI